MQATAIGECDMVGQAIRCTMPAIGVVQFLGGLQPQFFRIGKHEWRLQQIQ
jgi:hypothetical protein